MASMRLMFSLSWIVRETEVQPVCHDRGPFRNGIHAGKNAVTRALSDGVSALAGAVWRAGIIARGVAMLALLLAAGGARAQVDALPDLSPPDPDACMRAFHAVRGVLAGAADATTLPAMNAQGAGILVRYEGRIIGRGFAVGEGSLERAVAAARAEIDRAIEAAPDAARQQAMREDLKRLTLSLELAGTLVPFEAATFADVDISLGAGIQGVAVRRGERSEAAFPGASMLSGRTPGDALASCIAQVLGDPSAPIRGSAKGEAGALAAANGLTFLHFRVAHLAQTQPGDQPRFLHRGARLVPLSEVNAAALVPFARGLAENLTGRLVITGTRYSFAGAHLPAAGREEPLISSPTDQCIAALALCEYAKAEAERTAAVPAIGAAREVIRALARPSKDAEPLWSDPRGCAAWLMAARALLAVDASVRPADSDQLEKIDTCLAGAFDESIGWGGGISEGDRGIIACALALRALGAPAVAREAARTEARAAVRSLYRDTPPEKLVIHMPWLGRAELLLAGNEEIAAGPALREFRDRVWEHQFRNAEDPDNADLAGGIVFTAGGNPYPTWQTARPLCFLAAMLGDARLTDKDEILSQVGKTIAGVRFLRQMSMDYESAWIAADRRKALWGVRVAPWDPRQPIEATAMTLMTVLEAKESVEEATRRLRP
ncbi:hypothetical protein PHYC_01568 [Phycisphaerales bacterium]|nr:hypothetical protein PHYC_01568 [Phycisphaerales bacterium]